MKGCICKLVNNNLNISRERILLVAPRPLKKPNREVQSASRSGTCAKN
jgi:hypothetical protein